MTAIIGKLCGLVWSNPLVYLALGISIYFTFRSGFVQIKALRDWKLLFAAPDGNTGISAFAAFCIAVGEKVGAGNIAGVAIAIHVGGPGAVFWMLFLAFVGAASGFVEGALAQMYKMKEGDEFIGGSMAYLGAGLNSKTVMKIFAVISFIGYGLFGVGVQVNTAAAAISTVPSWLSSLILVGLCALVVIGGVRRIAAVAEKLVPFMTLIYLCAALIIIVLNISRLPEVVGLIISSAFGWNAVFGGMVGAAIITGVQRGVFSSGSALGVGALFTSSANVSHPAKQGIVHSLAIFVDTLIICNCTAMMILFTGSYNVVSPEGAALVTNLPGVEGGIGFVKIALDTLIKSFGSGFAIVAIWFFTFTTLMAQHFFGHVSLLVATKDSSEKTKRLCQNLFTAAFLVLSYLGGVANVSVMWNLADLGLGIMCWVNIFTLFFMQKPAMLALQDYNKKRKTGAPLTFKGSDIGLKLECWPDD